MRAQDIWFWVRGPRDPLSLSPPARPSLVLGVGVRFILFGSIWVWFVRIWGLGFVVWCLVFGVWFLVFGVWRLVFGVRCLVFRLSGFGGMGVLISRTSKAFSETRRGVIGSLLPNNQCQHRTLHIQRDVLPYAVC